MGNSVVFKANTVLWGEYTVKFWENTVVIGSKNSDILGRVCLFGKIQWYLAAITAVFGETQ